MCCEAEQEGGGGEAGASHGPAHSSVQAAIGAKLCFLGMPRLQSSLWGSAGFLPTCQAGLGSILAWCRAMVCWQLCTWHSMAEHRQSPCLLLSCVFLMPSYPHPSPQPPQQQQELPVTQHGQCQSASLPPPRANRPCGSVNTLSAFIWAAGAGIAHPFVPRNTCGSWIQQSSALFLKQMLLAGSFAYPVYENQGELLLLLNRKR